LLFKISVLKEETEAQSDLHSGSTYMSQNQSLLALFSYIYVV